MFGRRRIAELEQLLTSVQMNSSNNYKDAAKADYETFWKRMAELKERGKINETAITNTKEINGRLR